ncbi:hypothetical protein LCGC14_2197620 [marine sediment metagenome]|uniref:Uncharacterized protein n=1 Tax=marine sediment metagenome TaxID=412755 RepID=A0A0F9E4T1_9ZZZZ
MAVGQTVEATLRGVCADNVSLAQDIQANLNGALGESKATTGTACEAVSPNIIQQALDSAQLTHSLLREIQETINAGILNRI